MALQAAVQAGTGEYCNARLQGVEAIVQRQERVAAKSDDGRCLLGSEHAGAGILRSRPPVLNPLATCLPFGYGLGVDAVALGQDLQARLTMFVAFEIPPI